ncbi:MAG: 2-oxo acid dehydrogenase subunit E2 [Deltaproteobacteria bacterium]|nr:MAG: 2-oxo acid dehydrogenase subunit E2 [Deltaproteobacteria bacterium]TMQ25413.1 MAG: 2-oxo acid dehydrogenase subunit E2 [Deltaproteobacteria bacterium]
MDVIMPQLGETVREGTISVWHSKVGDAVSPDQPLFEVETDKVTVDVPAPAAGVLAQILVAVGERVEVGTRLAVIQTAGEDTAVSTSPQGAAPSSSASAAATAGRSARATAMPSATSIPGAGAPVIGRADPAARLSPVVRKLLAEHHISDPSVIVGTGAEGRITRDDVLAYVVRSRAQTAPGGDTVVAMSRIRKRTAEHMLQSVATSPHVLQAVEVDFAAVERLRGAAGEAFRAREGFSLSYLPFVARAVCQAVPEFPHVNASVRGDALVVHHRVNLGIAVDLDREGLIVPVIKDAAHRTVRELAVEIHRLADRARRGALGPDDLTEGTYTISNSGTFGTLFTAPIILQPQVAILSTDGVRKRPWVVQGAAGDTIEIRPIGVLAQCFDHRAFDGAYSAAFLRRVRELLERAHFGAEL